MQKGIGVHVTSFYPGKPDREEVEATKRALAEVLSKAKKYAETASQTGNCKACLNFHMSTVARLARKNAKTKKALSEALSRAEEEKLYREDAAVTNRALEKALGRAREENRIARDALSKAEEESKLVREDAEAAKRALEEALSRGNEENQLAGETVSKVELMPSQYNSGILHKLRTPLHSIVGFSKLLLDGKVTDTETQKEFLTIINQQSEHLRDLIDELAEVSNIESDRPDTV